MDIKNDFFPTEKYQLLVEFGIKDAELYKWIIIPTPKLNCTINQLSHPFKSLCPAYQIESVYFALVIPGNFICEHYSTLC